MRSLQTGGRLAIVAVALWVGVVGCSEQAEPTGAASSPREVDVSVPVQLPDGVIAKTNSVLIWMDVENVSRASFDETADAMISVLNDQQQLEAKAEFEAAESEIEQMFAIRQDVVDAGVRAMVLAMGPDGSDDPAGPATQPGEGDPEAPPPASQPKEREGQILFLIRPGTSPQQTIIDSMVAIKRIETDRDAREAAAAGDEDAPEVPEQKFDPQSVAFEQVADDWLVMIGDGMVPPVGADEPTLETATYVEALRREKDAVVRMAWVMNEPARIALREQMSSGFGAMFLAPLLQPMQQMKDATAGVWLGSDPKARIAFNFDSPMHAQQFKGGVDSLVMMIGGLMSMGTPDTPEARARQQKTQTALALVIPNLEAETVHKTIDLAMLRKMAEAGMPWTGADDEQDEAATQPTEAP